MKYPNSLSVYPGLQIFLLAGAIASMLTLPTAAQLTIDFDELNPPIQGNGGHYFDGYGADAVMGNWSSGDADFNTNMFGPGLSYSNINNITTPGFTNQWAAITGVDVSNGGNYALASTFTEDGAYINLPAGWQPDYVFVTNSTFAYISMENGDAFAKKFGGVDGNDPDFFTVTFRGFSESDAQGPSTGEVEFYLADFRFANNSKDYIVDAWVWVDLSELTTAKSIGISFDSSDVGQFGINTPVYVAFDHLTLMPSILLGDVNLDGVVDLLDVAPFVELLANQGFQAEADVNSDGLVNLLDVAPFIAILTG